MMLLSKDVYIWPGYKNIDLLFGKAKSRYYTNFILNISSFPQDKNILCFWDLGFAVMEEGFI